jgi:hypothetical protein
MKQIGAMLGLVLVVGSTEVRAQSTFAGKWETTFGPMVLTQEGAVVTGAYFYGGKRCTVQGKVEKGKLTFTYREPAASGEGWFELADNGRTFTGKWREKGQIEWGEWRGKRVLLGFDGLWQTSYGRMRLVQTESRVDGVYAGGAVSGELKGKRLEFKYGEAEAKGQGWFELAADGNSFQGKWKEDRESAWHDWVGKRVEPVAGRSWLVVLEAPWELGLEQSEYSFGNMLRAYFTLYPRVQVRHKMINSESALRKWCAELPYLAEPVVLVIASHGSEKGLLVGGKSVGAKALAESLRYASNVRLLHLSACLTMKGSLAKEITAGLGKGRSIPISGYTTCVDWGASAVIEFMYLDFVLGRGMAPRQAAQRLVKVMPFSGDKQVAGAPFQSAGFRLLDPSGE